jgi:hypothetical protein
VKARRVSWTQTTADASYEGFRAYLDAIFTYAGSASLAKELAPVDLAQVQPGDLFIQGGAPGHAVVVLDVARDAEGRAFMLLGQSYMPAQEFHLLKNPGSPRSPWYAAGAGEKLVTPEWTFRWTDLKRFTP